MNGPIKSQFHVNEKNIQMERKKNKRKKSGNPNKWNSDNKW